MPADRASTTARRASARSVPPLVIMALAFVLPLVKGCDHVESALEESTDYFLAASILVPSYVVAAILATITVIALMRRRTPDGSELTLSTGAISLGLASPIVGMFREAVTSAPTAEPTDLAHPINLWSIYALWWVALLAAGPAGGVWLYAARRRQGWVRWHGIIGALLWMSAPIATWIGIGVVQEGTLYSGGALFLGAWLAILVVRVVAVASRRAEASRAV